MTMHPESSFEPRSGISYDSLSPEVRPYADNLEAQIWAVFAKYSLSFEGRGQGEGVEHPLELLKAKNPTTEDLEYLSDLLDQLDHIRKTGEPLPRTKRELSHLALEFSYNETEATRLGLKRVEVKGYPEAQKLIEAVINGDIDTSDDKKQQKFIQAWVESCPDLFIPARPGIYGDRFSYLEALKQGRVISNLSGDPKPLSPHWNDNEILLIDDWKEEIFGTKDARTKLKSLLIEELFDNGLVIKISREEVDAVLWKGDPGDRIPTKKHENIIKNLGLDPDIFELRLIRQDEYARLAKEMGWGQRGLWTHFDGYILTPPALTMGLIGGDKEFGGPSHVGSIVCKEVTTFLSVRLVVARKLS